MKKPRVVIPVLVFALSAPLVYGGGAAEGASTTSRGDYLAGQGRIIPSSEVYVDSYLSQIDYHYPDSEDPVTIHLYPSSRLLSASGEDLWLQVGLQGKRTPFEEIAPLYLVVVIDTSGSMSEANKLDWAKQSVSVLLSKLRVRDSVSVVTFSDTPKVLVEKQRLSSQLPRDRINEAVEALVAFGSSRSGDAIDLAYRTMGATAVSGEIRRILFLSDGQGVDKAVIAAAKRRFEQSKTPLTTVGYGTSFNLAGMTELARECSGSSRFISDREQMEKEFYSDLDRMVVSIARDVDVVLQVPPPLSIIETWGYQNRVTGNEIHFHLPTVHLRDYETMLIHLTAPATGGLSHALPVTVTVRYGDLSGAMRSTVVRTDLAYSPASLPGLLPSHTNTAQAVMMLDIARGLQKVGLLDEAAKEWTKLRSRAYSSYRTVQEFYDLKEYDTVVDALRRADPDELTMAVRYLYQDAMDTTIEIRRRIELFNTVLGTDYFPAERQILEKYISILQAPASLRDPDAYAWSLDPILPEMLPQVGADKIVSSMLRELLQWIPASVADVHVSPAFARVGAGEVPEGTKQRLDSVLRGALTAVGSGSLHADGPVGEDGISRIDLAAELAAIDASQRYVIRAYIVDLYGAAHLALRLIDSREKRLVAFTAATVAALEPSFPARLR